jgi:orotate phosphoribosyltransferase
MLDPNKHLNGAFISDFLRPQALWAHNGDAKAPHALLTKGVHSNGFFNWGAVRDGDRVIAKRAIKALTWSDIGLVEHFDDVDVVMGPQTGGTYIAQQIAHEICRTWSSPRKEPLPDGTKRFVFDGNDESTGRYPEQSMRFLVCEDVITTSASVAASIVACEELQVTVLPFVLCIVNRSSLTHVGDRRIISLLDIPMQEWNVPGGEVCPLCAGGSEAIRPKEGSNWQRLQSGV